MIKANYARYDIMACAALVAVMVFVPSLAQANFDTILCKAVGLINSQAGKAIATAAVLILGVGAILGRIQWGQAVLFAAGIAAIFGSTAILNAIGAEGCTVGLTGGGGGGYVYFWHMR